MLQVSAVPPPLDPGSVLSSFNTTLYSVEVSNLVVDGRGRAGIGIYALRCANQSVFENLRVRNCVHWGILGLGLYGGTWHHIQVQENRNIGLQLGGRPWASWSSGITHTTVNALHLDTLVASGNGVDWPQLVAELRERGDPYLVSPRIIGAGVCLYLHRGNLITNVDSEWNRGPGIYLASTSGPNTILSGYTEMNGHFLDQNNVRTVVDFLRFDRPVGVWIETNPYWIDPASTTRPAQHLVVQGFFLSGVEWIRFSGEPNPGRPEARTILREVGPGAGIFEDTPNSHERDHCFQELG
jgi:hypothetical protein